MILLKSSEIVSQPGGIDSFLGIDSKFENTGSAVPDQGLYKQQTTVSVKNCRTVIDRGHDAVIEDRLYQC